MMKPQGLQIDLRDQLSNFSFSQVFLGPCNPALSNFQTCFLYETLDAGAQGVSGTLRLSIKDSVLSGDYDVSIEGYTDRFGDPTQWNKHGTIANVSAAIVDQLP
jgi:hypothetical protein